jgi:hypothetical protein
MGTVACRKAAKKKQGGRSVEALPSGSGRVPTGDKVKILETIERECCQQQDMKPYQGVGDRKDKKIFCIHCGQVWGENSFMDESGSRDYMWVKRGICCIPPEA